MAAPAEVRATEASIVWSHTRPDGQPWYTAEPSLLYGENLVCSSKADGEHMFTLLWNSPTHKDNNP